MSLDVIICLICGWHVVKVNASFTNFLLAINNEGREIASDVSLQSILLWTLITINEDNSKIQVKTIFLFNSFYVVLIEARQSQSVTTLTLA